MLAELDDLVFIVKRSDRDVGGILLESMACSVTLDVEGGVDLNWPCLDSQGFQPAFRRRVMPKGSADALDSCINRPQ